MKTILIIADYFGEWPKWFGMFLKSCEFNPTIHWRIHTDCAVPERAPTNVEFVNISREAYVRRASDILGLSFGPKDMYNICDLRPTFGVLYADIIRGYDYFGWGDVDVVYGDIRKFYTDEVLSHNVICSNARTCTGHFTLIRNESWLRECFKHIPNWRQRLEDPDPHPWSDSLDEAKLSGIFSPVAEVREEFGERLAGLSSLSKYWQNNYFREQWSTPFIPYPWHDGSRLHPEVWYWQNGHLRNEWDGEREFLYLHLMNFKAKKYVDEDLYGTAPTWEGLSTLIHFDCNEIRGRAVRIDRRGFHLNEAADESRLMKQPAW